MKEFLKLIRWQNLLIVAFTMILMRYAVLEPLLGSIHVRLYDLPGTISAMSLQLPLADFIVLVLATLFIAAGGYVINDYFDIKTDLINRGQVIVGTKIPRRKAMMWHNILNIAGVAAGFYVSWRIGYFLMGTMFLVVSGLLYFYSASYKRQFLVGNLIVAVLTAMVPMLVVIYEAPLIFRHYTISSPDPPSVAILFWWVGGFSVFAFLITLTRELIKDIEDFEGDLAYGRNTVPVIIGILTSRIVAISLVIITISLLYLAWYSFIRDLVTLVYISAAIALPLLLVVYLLVITKTRTHLHRASNLMKVIMLTGILYSVVVKILLHFNLV